MHNRHGANCSLTWGNLGRDALTSSALAVASRLATKRTSGPATSYGWVLRTIGFRPTISRAKWLRQICYAWPKMAQPNGRCCEVEICPLAGRSDFLGGHVCVVSGREKGKTALPRRRCSQAAPSQYQVHVHGSGRRRCRRERGLTDLADAGSRLNVVTTASARGQTVDG